MTYPPQPPPYVPGAIPPNGDWRPPTPERNSRLLPVLLIVLVVVTVVTVAALGALARHKNLLPTSVPLIGKDSGVAACESIVKEGELIETSGKDRMTADEYREARAIFGDSRYPAIRENGVKIIDIAWQLGNSGEDGAGLLMYATSLSDAYAGLTGGCAEVGYTLPPLTGG
jgi:hypothetical protein